MAKKGTHIIILTTARSGSTLLYTLLGSHSSLCCESEIFNYFELGKFPAWLWPYIRKYPSIYIKYRMFRNRNIKPYYGFKIFPDQVTDLLSVLRYTRRKEFKLICLKRNNIIKQAISFAIALHRRKWMVENEKDFFNEVITLQPENILIYLRRFIEHNKCIDSVVANFNPIWVDYEAELLNPSNHPAFIARICGELEFDVEPLTSRVLPTDKRSDRERIENLAEILDYLDRQGYHQEVLCYKEYEKISV